MLNFRRFGTFRFPFASQIAQAFCSGMARRSRSRRMSASPEVLEVRQVLSAATLSATLVNGLLTVSDTSQTNTNNSLTAMMVGTDLVISDANEQFIAAPAGGALSNGGKTLTIPANLVDVGLTIDAGLGDDIINVESIDGAFSTSFIVDGEAGSDTINFQTGPVSVGGFANVTAETINVNAAVTAGGAINLTSTGDDTALTIAAPVIAGGNSLFSADKMVINSTVDAGSHTLTLVPDSTADAFDTINIGATTDISPDTLELSNAELDRLTAATIAIGDLQTADISITAPIAHAGDSQFVVQTAHSITFAPGSGWATVNGGLSFDANPNATWTGNSSGIDLNNATLSTSGTGGILLRGHGGNSGSSNIGVYAHDQTVLQSTGLGQMALLGFGGEGVSNNRGVQISDTSITSAAGNIQITGRGGDSSAEWNMGVWIISGTTIAATGNAQINISGSAGNGSYDNIGVALNGFGYGYDGPTHITSENGDISISGSGPDTSTGPYNWGVAVLEGAVIQATGTGDVNLSGSGDAGTLGSVGVQIADTNTLLSVASGDLNLSGSGGDAGASSYGVWIHTGPVLQSTGTGQINISGSGGNNDDSRGVLLDGSGIGTHISSVNGDISISGSGGDSLTGSDVQGVGIFNAAVIESTGTAKIFISGTGGAASSKSRGIVISDEGTRITSVGGNIQLSGAGGAGTGDQNFGVWVCNTAAISATGSASITIDGTGGSGVNDNNGIVFNNYGSGGGMDLTVVDGDLTLIGHGSTTATGSGNRGIAIYDAARIRSTGTGKISLNGTGGSGTDSARGVEMAYGTLMTSVAGDVQIVGQGGSNVSGYGVWITLGASVTVSGEAKVTIEGTGPDANDAEGVVINNAARIWSGNGDISITGKGGNFAESSVNRGIVVSSGAIVQAFGTGNVTLDGTAGSGTFNERGVEVADADTKIVANSGQISITGHGGAGSAVTDSNNVGVIIRDGAVVESTAVTGQAGTILIDGTGGAGSGLDYGVWLSGGSRLISHVGDIQVTGHGAAGTGDRNLGVWIGMATTVTTAGNGSITIAGTGGSGGSENNGVLFNGFGYGGATKVSSENGDIVITGQGSTTATGAGSRGICILENATVQSTGTGKITLNGTGGTGTNGARGVELAYGALVTSVIGDIQITGQGGATTSGFGTWISVGSTVESTGTAKITIEGTAGLANDAIGVEVSGQSLVSSVDGDVTIHGHGADFLAGSANHGLVVASGSVISSTGSARITLEGTGGAGSGSSRGIEIADAGTTITSLHGDISISGQGGTSDSGNYNVGVLIRDGVVVESTATTGTVAKISIQGTGGTGTAGEIGVWVGSSSLVSSLAGDVSITGNAGAGTGDQNMGVWITREAEITAAGSGRIDIDGTGAGFGSENTGVLFNGFEDGPALVQVENGDLTITGIGSTTSTGTSSRGIGVLNATTIQATGTGKITLNGTGGTGTRSNFGTQVFGGSSIVSAGGDIQITGQGGAASGEQNFGVWMAFDATVTATGTGRITIDGTGGGGTKENNGVTLNGYGFSGVTRITAEDGDIMITGQGSTTASGSSNRGIGIYDDVVVRSTGTARITVDGTGGTGTDAARGVELAYAGATITSAVGDIHITGHGGPTTYAQGVLLYAGPVIESTGTAKITVEGTGGNQYAAGGVFLDGEGVPTRITSVDGDINIIGQGGTALTGSEHRGVAMFSGAAVQSTGAAKIVIHGTGGSGDDSSRGVEIGDLGTQVSSANGDIQITGQGGNNVFGFGIWVRSGALIQSTNNAKITLDGTGGNNGGNDLGVAFGGYGVGGPTMTSLNGDITVIGHGGNAGSTGAFSAGVGFFEGSVVTSLGTAKISIDGTGGSGIGSERGVEIGDGTTIASQVGDISITGHGGATTITTGDTSNVGIWIRDNAIIKSTATEGPAAKITINGTAGAGYGRDIGVLLSTGGRVTSTLGDVSVTGHGGAGTGLLNIGVNLSSGAAIASTGTAKITVDGTAISGNGAALGVYVDDHSVITSTNGDILITGQGGTGGSTNIGIGIQGGASVESTGTAKITLNGTGGAGTDSSYGIRIIDQSSMVRSAAGDISVTGVGGTGIAGANTSFNSGVNLQAGGSIISTSTAKINVTGTGGTGLFNAEFGVGQVGVWLLDSNSKISSKDGDVTVTGFGGGDSGTSGNHGVKFQSGTIETSGSANVRVTGTQGVGTSSFGIQVQSGTGNAGVNTSAGTGNITLVADGINIDTVSQPGAIRAGANSTTIHPLTNNAAINLGGIDASGVLGLTAAELDRIFTGTLIVGDNSTGAITVSADITRLAATNMALVSGGNVVIAGGQLDTHGGTLVLDSGAAPDFVNPLHAGVDVAATTTTLDGDLSIAINGSLVDTGYTQFNVAGGVNLNGVSLILSGSYIPQFNDSFIIVNNDGGEPITGKFNGLAEGTIFSFNGRSLQISYVGGSNGNDVVLTTVNLAPVAVDAAIETNEDTSVNGTLQATDVDSPSLTYSIAVNPTHGTVNITDTATGAYTYTPDANYNGSDSFMFRAYDGQLNSNPATVSITIVAVNDAPQLNLNGGAVTFSGKAAKKDGPPQIVPNVTVVDPDQSGTSGLGGGTLTISIDASVKTSKNKVKLHDTIGGISNASSLGTTTGALLSNGKLVLTIQLNAGTTTNDLQTFLRGITFSTKGPGLKLTPRTFQAQLTDGAGAASNLLLQTVNVAK